MCGLWGGAVALAGFLASRSGGLDLWWALPIFGAFGVIAERQSVPLTKETEASVAFIPLVFVAVVAGPLPAMLVGAGVGLGDLRPPYMRWLTYTPVRAICAALAGLAAAPLTAAGAPSFTRLLLASSAAALAHQGSDLTFNIGTLSVRRANRPAALLPVAGPLLLLSLAFYVPLIALLAYGYYLYSVWIVAVFLVPAVALQRVTRLYQEQRVSAAGLSAANDRLARANLSFATALVATLDARDRYTAGHSAAVAVYARDIARRMNLSDDDRQLVHLAGLVHDIGKIGLPAGLLEKPGALTLDERRQMETHSEIGERILANVEDYSEIAAIVRHHHERVDGLGYPDGLHGEDIPLLARIIAVADAYNAMTSDRPYRDAMPSRVARLRLAQAVDSQFDTGVVACFEAILASAPESYRHGILADFTLDADAGENLERDAAAIA